MHSLHPRLIYKTFIIKYILHCMKIEDVPQELKEQIVKEHLSNAARERANRRWSKVPKKKRKEFSNMMNEAKNKKHPPHYKWKKRYKKYRNDIAE